MAKKEIKIPTGILKKYDMLIATNPDIERKGVTMPYTSHNGHMFTHLSPEGVLGIRLPKGEFEKFIEKYGARQYMQYGRKMREYVEVPQELLDKTDELKKYLDISFEYIKTLKPKPSKKKK